MARRKMKDLNVLIMTLRTNLSGNAIGRMLAVKKLQEMLAGTNSSGMIPVMDLN